MAERPPAVVLDLNVLVSGFLAERSGTDTPPAHCLAAARRGALHLRMTPAMLERLRRVLAYPKLAFDSAAVDAILHELTTWIGENGWIADAPRSKRTSALCPDPEDDLVLRTALRSRASFLVTGDRDLRERLTPQGAKRIARAGLRIVTAMEFISQARGTEHGAHSST